jgi:hypothetical protein
MIDLPSLRLGLDTRGGVPGAAIFDYEAIVFHLNRSLPSARVWMLRRENALMSCGL